MTRAVAHDRPHAAGRPAAARRIWQALLLVLALYVVEQDVEALLGGLKLLSGAGQYGASSSRAPDFRAGYIKLAKVEPGGPAARAGLANGDHVRFSPVYDYLRHPLAGDIAHLTLRRGGEDIPVTVRAEPVPKSSGPGDIDAAGVATIMSCLAPALFGAFILWRSRARGTPLLLGAVLVTYGLAHFVPQGLLTRPGLFLPLYVLGVVNFGSIVVLFAAFAVRFVTEASGRPRPAAWRALGAFAAVYGVIVAAFGYAIATATLLPLVGNASLWTTLFSAAGFVVAFAYLARGWRHAPRETQRRYSLVLLASALIMLAQLGFSALAGGLAASVDGILRAASEVLGGLIAPALFAYAILRQRVFDLGFAINRTVVYGLVSAILLAVFGLLEWAVHHFIPIEGRATNAFLDAAIALAVYFAFHGVLDAVEHWVERLFFREWHERETALRKFVHDARHIQRAPALRQAVLDALVRFSDGAEVALYLADAKGDFRLAAGAAGLAPKRIDADAQTVVTLRADGATVDLQHLDPDLRPDWAAALALPMLNRSVLAGFILMGPKTLSIGYRPDELTVLGHAAHQVGLDLHWIETEALQRQLAALTAGAAPAS